MKKSQILIALGVLVVLLILVLMLHKSPYDAKQEKPDVAIPAMTADTISSIEITNPQADAEKNVTLTKEGDTWMVTAPKTFKADANIVKSTVDKLAELDVTGIRSKKKAKHELFEVSEEKGINIKVTTSEGKTFAFILGKNSKDFRNSFIRLPGDDKVYVIKGAIKSYMSREIKNWRDKGIFDLDKTTVKSIAINEKQGKKTVHNTFERNEDGSWKVMEHQDFKADKNKVESLANQVATLRTHDFIDEPAALTEYGLDDPDMVVKVLMNDNKEHVLLIGKANEKNQYYAKVAAQDKPLYLLAKWQVERYQKELDFYEDKGPGAAPTPQMPAGGMPAGIPKEMQQKLQQQLQQQQMQ